MKNKLQITLLLTLFSIAAFSQNAVNNVIVSEKDGAHRTKLIRQQDLNLGEQVENLFKVAIPAQAKTNAYLLIQSDQEFHLFDKDKLIGKSSNASFQMSVDSLRSLLASDTVMILSGKTATTLSYRFVQEIPTKIGGQQGPKVELQPRLNQSKFNNSIIVLLIMFCGLLVGLKVAFPKRFQEAYSVSRNFSLRPFEGDNLRLRLFEQDGLYIALIYTFGTALLIYLYFFPKETGVILYGAEGIVIDFFKAWGFFALLLIAKVALVFVISTLYKSGRFNTFYIKELFNISTFFITVLVIFTGLLFLYKGQLPLYWWTFIKSGLLVSYLVRLILVYFKILKLSGFTNLYLFSYFCSTEIFPFVIGLKYFY